MCNGTQMEFSNSTGEPLLSKSKSSGGYAIPIILLFATIALETLGTLMLKHSLVDNRMYAIAFVSYFTSLATFSYVLKYIPLSIAYTTWCTLGTVSVCVLSSFIYGESLKPLKWACVVLTIPCMVGLYVI